MCVGAGREVVACGFAVVVVVLHDYTVHAGALAGWLCDCGPAQESGLVEGGAVSVMPACCVSNSECCAVHLGRWGRVGLLFAIG